MNVQFSILTDLLAVTSCDFEFAGEDENGSLEAPTSDPALQRSAPASHDAELAPAEG